MKPKTCTWPNCLDEKQHAELVRQVDDSMHGRPTTSMPDQRLICRCPEGLAAVRRERKTRRVPFTERLASAIYRIGGNLSS